ncbi:MULTISPECIES: carbohydrate ABC transporter permease [Glycomyces]|uniref:Carbohydrate ABC transporter permease n=2 Tax=Glycomyces TaxID=58113 RepID=A0A9X3PXW1_9ACTN|nr:carbohydrate ABC transporter permease [Glycomyces lechevalierae]MDA1388058.1 carbohydrate ABC transporter permease [Glycomyces lechevalierae]MDR7338770.1 raffinose/stachyose/melibiose transport system permease protein [Glycomyces lechevalierae]
MSVTTKRGKLLRNTGFYAAAFAAAIFVATPILFALLGGFKDNEQLRENSLGLPNPWNWQHYTDVLVDATFWRQLGNSVFIAVASTFIVVAAAAAVAYVFARFEFRGREGLFTLFAAGMMFPFAVAVLPLFIILRTFEMLNSPFGVILPQAAFGLPLTIIILRSFFRQIPGEVEEAATIDGAGPWRFFLQILLPMSRPVLATVSVLALVGSWNSYLLPLVVFTKPTWQTLPLGVTQFQGEYSSDTAKVLAYVMLAMLPALIFYAFAERQLISGLTSGGTKG